MTATTWLRYGTDQINGLIDLIADRLSSITPTALAAGDTNDYAPVDATTSESFAYVDVIRQATNVAGSTLTGLTAQTNGKLVVLQNLGSGTLTVKNESTASLAANRFTLAGGSDLALASGASAIFVYDGVTSRWLLGSSAGSGGGITNGAASNVVTKSNGTNVVASQITDDGTLVSITGTGTNAIVKSVNFDIANTFHQTIERMAPSPIVGHAGQELVQYTLQVTPNAYNGSLQSIEAIIDGTVLCDGVDRSTWCVEGHAVSTRAPGSTGRLANIAILSNAYTGGDGFIDAYSFYSDNGVMRNIGAAVLGPVTMNGFTIATNIPAPYACNFSAAGAITLNNNVSGFQVPSGIVTIGQSTSVNDGTQFQTKNYSNANADCGISIGVDTTVLANARGGVHIWRGASGGFGGANEAGFVFAGAAGNYIVGAAAGDLCVFNTTPSQNMLFSSDGTGFTAGARLDPSGNFQAKALVTGATMGTGATIRSGTGSPAGVVTGNPGDLYLNLSGGAGTTLYVKESGTGNTAGWVAK